MAGAAEAEEDGHGQAAARLKTLFILLKLTTIPLDPVREKRTKPTVLTSRLTGDFILCPYLDSSWTR